MADKPPRNPQIEPKPATLAHAPAGAADPRRFDRLPASGARRSVGPVTKLPLPRFASLKTDRVNLREGPSKDHPTKWVYQRAGLPVEITAEFEIWRRVRDSEGVEGWVLHSLLSGRRTALVTPSKKGENSKIYVRPSESVGPGGDPAVRRHRQHPQLRRGLVLGRRRWFQGLHPAGEAVGRLSRREDRVRRKVAGRGRLQGLYPAGEAVGYLPNEKIE